MHYYSDKDQSQASPQSSSLVSGSFVFVSTFFTISVTLGFWDVVFDSFFAPDPEPMFPVDAGRSANPGLAADNVFVDGFARPLGRGLFDLA